MRVSRLAVAALFCAAAISSATDVVTSPFPGVGISRVHRTLTSPRVLNINVLVFDLTDPRIEFLVTPEDPTFQLDYELARTTTYVTQWGLDGAINANFWSGGLGSEGDPREVIGPVVSNGSMVHAPRPQSPYDPALAILPDGSAFCDYLSSLGNERECVAGIGYDDGQTGTLLVTNGVNTGSTARPAPYTADPRTVAGVSQDGHTLVWAVIDGRTANSQGMTLSEAADLLIEFGVWDGVNLDGGGSTTMVLRLPDQGPQIINLTTGAERAVANHLGFRVIAEHVDTTLVAAFAFGATDHTQPVYNDSSAEYIKVRQVSGSTTSIEYDPGRGYGYTDLTGLNTVPNDNSTAFNGDQIYAENIGVRGSVGSIVFRADVPNGTYRFVAAGGDAGEYNHVTKIRVRDGGSETWVNMIDHEHVYRPTIWRVGFADKIPPPADGSGHDSGTYVDPTFRPLFHSCTIKVVSGYLEFEQIGKGVNSPDKWGGDLSLLELWRLPLGTPDIDEDGDVDLDDYGIFVDCLTGPPATTATDFDTNGVVDVDDFEVWLPCLTGAGVAPGEGCGDMDLDADNDVDLADFQVFQDSFTGPGGNFPPGCEVADFDIDHDVDLVDFAAFQEAFTGP